MTDEESRDWLKRWAEIRKSLPKGIKIVAEAGNAFGTEFTGFTIFEGPFAKFEELHSNLELYSSHLVEKTRTIIGTKGIGAPKSQLQKILRDRPID
ncbi:MAG: hypothetical protein JSW61_04205 [Candidatus Thorarchaeota archaeon]|nr:MAG: hypothetical protein JSW61_04205 [Candidatus Thorarchaeota archaeon]